MGLGNQIGVRCLSVRLGSILSLRKNIKEIRTYMRKVSKKRERGYVLQFQREGKRKISQHLP